MKLDWRGSQVRDRVAGAAALAVDQTMAACVQQAKHVHPWINETGVLDASVRITLFAVDDGEHIVGEWGSAAVFYALYQEIGTSRVGPTAEERVMASDGWATIAGPQPGEGVSTWVTYNPYVASLEPRAGATEHVGPLMHARAFLRPAADMQYPLLRARIRANLQLEG